MEVGVKLDEPFACDPRHVGDLRFVQQGDYTVALHEEPRVVKFGIRQVAHRPLVERHEVLLFDVAATDVLQDAMKSFRSLIIARLPHLLLENDHL